MIVRIVSILFVLTLATPAFSVTMRYALIVGNNDGFDDDGKQPFPSLLHAEREAKELKRQLVGISNFDKSAKRTRLLVGGTTQEVREAVDALAKQKARDQAMFGTMESIFLFYYTGHGLSGRLLLKDGPLRAETIKDLFNSVGADFSVGVFDACYAGSVLMEKGIRPAPPLDMVQDFPAEVLSAKGSVWYVSSGSKESSYEDHELGGVFTHFFIEALVKAQQDGPGITLDKIWQYVREHTTEYTAAHSRKQIPEQFVSKLRSKAPVYFSFPVPRNANLVLSKDLEGRFALSYADGHLTEVFEKRRGKASTIPIYPGRAKLMLIGDQSTREHPFSLNEGGTLVIHTMPKGPPEFGERATPLFAKGDDDSSPRFSVNRQIRATKLEPGVSAFVGAGYAFSLTIEQLLHPRHRFRLPVRLDWGAIFLDFSGGFGIDRRQYPAWSYRVKMAGGELGAGYGWRLGTLRFNTKASFVFSRLWQHFKSGRKKLGWQYQPTLSAALLLTETSPAIVEIAANVGPVYSEGSGFDSQKSWFVFGGAGITLYYRLM